MTEQTQLAENIAKANEKLCEIDNKRLSRLRRPRQIGMGNLRDLFEKEGII